MVGELRALMFIAFATKARALAGPPPTRHSHAAPLEERKHCPECQEWDKAQAAAWEKVRAAPGKSLRSPQVRK